MTIARTPVRPARVGRRRSTTKDHIANVAIDLFETYGFGEVSVDDVALAAGIARRTLFRYYPSKNAIPWGDFDAHLREFAKVFDDADLGLPITATLRAALLDFNTFEESEAARHRRRMRLILESPELQAYSMTLYAGWRDVVAAFIAGRTGAQPSDLVPQTVGWTMLGVALAAHEHWLARREAADSQSLRDDLGDAFDAISAGLP
ncbi:MAG: mycofactocin system transcriptional regulator [Mycobacteriaceae bacterium]